MPTLVCTLLSIASYFQATGISHLLSSSLAADLDLVQPRSRQDTSSATVRGERKPSVSAKPILSRNPFDSVTGPLDAKPADQESVPEKKLDLSDPLGAPECEGVVVLATTESTDPEWSMAVVKGPGDPEGRVRRVGDRVAGRQVAYIGYNRRELSPAVWFVDPTSLCQVALFDDDPPAKAKPKKKAQRPKSKKAAKKSRRGPPPVPKEIADKIERVSATQYNVDRSAVDAILEEHAQLMKSARIMPVKKGRQVVGIKLLNVKPNTLLGTLGFKHGDTLSKINGYDMTSPQKALQAYAKLRTVSQINVEIQRGGKPVTVTYDIR